MKKLFSTFFVFVFFIQSFFLIQASREICSQTLIEGGCCLQDGETQVPWTTQESPSNKTIFNAQQMKVSPLMLFIDSSISLRDWVRIEKTVDTCGLKSLPKGASSSSLRDIVYILPAITEPAVCEVGFKIIANCPKFDSAANQTQTFLEKSIILNRLI